MGEAGVGGVASGERDYPFWMAKARAYEGLAEVPGPTSNTTIVSWAKNMGGWVAAFFRDDATPWCSLFVNRVLQESGLSMSGSEGSAALLRARSFETYGRPLEIPAVGAVVVFSRDGGGHVGFYCGETLHAIRCLGGNTNDRVQETWISKRRLVATRWPVGPSVPEPGGRKWLRPDGEPLSLNEA